MRYSGADIRFRFSYLAYSFLLKISDLTGWVYNTFKGDLPFDFFEEPGKNAMKGKTISKLIVRRILGNKI